MPDADALLAANVNPSTGLATDYLNLFNEYIMLAEMVADGSMDPEVLSDWQPIDYESHFAQSGFAGADMVLLAYRSLPHDAKLEFEEAVTGLIDLILSHQQDAKSVPDFVVSAGHQRDHVATMISDPTHETDMDNGETQAEIDALFA